MNKRPAKRPAPATYKDAQRHFKKADPRLHMASLEHEVADIVAAGDLYHDIVWTIIGQQLSGRAADTIFERFKALFPKGEFDERKVLKLPESKLRSVGISGAKARAIRDLSEKSLKKEVDLKGLPNLQDSLVIENLTRVKGIGPWTAEMLLMFSLGRTDIFSPGDLGLRKGFMHVYGMKRLPSEKTMKRTTDTWSPYRTYGARILWRVADAKKARVARKRK